MSRYRRAVSAGTLVYSSGGEFQHRAVQVGDLVGRGLENGPHVVVARTEHSGLVVEDCSGDRFVLGRERFETAPWAP